VAASVPVTVLGGAVQFATQRADAVNRDPSTLLSVCRLIPEKGVDVVLEALAVLAKRGKHLSYIVIGDGPDRARLQKLAKNLGLGAQVQFWGNVDDDMLEEAYARAAALVLMSRPGNRVEGLGLVFLEAQARGVPVIGARAMGIPEAVGEAGILVDHFLSPAAIADAIESLLGDPDLQRRLAEAGKERVRNLTPQAMAKRLLVVAREQGCLS
jgi:phosphatidylinositol alpha-1,6-mannosyltransferase